jgi:hypothetical protein
MCALGAAVLTLPGIYLPERGSLIDLTLRRIAHDWHYQRYYNQYHLYFVPNHLKPALIRSIEVVGGHALSLSDLKTLLLPPPEASGEAELECESIINREMTYLDLSGSVGRAIQLKELTEFLFPSNQTNVSEEPEDSWDVAAETAPSPPRSLLPNLTHISLAIEPQQSAGVSWKQLLHFSSRLSSITHLSLAFWPEPCLTPQARNATVSTPQGRNIPYGGTSYYSHSLDDDWSEALLVLRMLSRNLYELEFLDLSGCGAWFKALMLELEHDHVDWTGSWGKISLLRLRVGWTPSVDTAPSEVVAYTEQMETAARIEKHIAAKRAGKGRIITVERDRPEI